jgi:hypothetical protein
LPAWVRRPSRKPCEKPKVAPGRRVAKIFS